MKTRIMKKMRGGGARLGRLALAFALVASGAGLSLAASTPAAQAADGSQVQIDSIEFENDTFEDYTNQRIAVEWSIPDQAETPVTLTVPLPPELVGNPDVFPLVGPDDAVLGECTVTATAVTCTVDDDYINENPFEVSGSFFFNAQSRLDNREETEHVFDFGDHQETVTVTPSRNWCTTNCEWGGTTGAKGGSSYNNLTDETVFTVWVAAPEQGLTPGLNVSVTDLLDPAEYEVIVDSEFPRVREARSVTYNRWGYERENFQNVPDLNVTWSADHQKATFVSRTGLGSDYRTGPAAPAEGATRGTDGTFYQVEWKVRALTGGELMDNGDRRFHNSAEWEINGEKSRTVSGHSTRYASGGTVVGTNYGKFQVTKELTGDTTLNPAFTVNYTATEPGQAAVNGTFTLHSGETFTSPEFFKGTVVTLTEVQPTDPANVNWATPVFLDEDGNPVDTLTFSTDGNGKLGQVTKLRLVNKAELRKANFSAQKTVVNADGVPLADDLTFDLDYSYPADAEKGFAAGSGTLTLPITGEEVFSGDLPVGAVVTFEETNFPNVPGATWGDAVIEPSTLTISDSEERVAVMVTNTITQDLGGFQITKNLIGDGASLVPDNAVFTVSYTYDAINGFPAGEGQIEFGAGETATVTGIPAGATVKLTELKLDDPTGASWGEPEFSESTFTIVKGTVVCIDLDNIATWNNGDFSILKQVTGDGADLVGADALFTVEYTYTLPDALGADPATGTGTLTVANDGQAVVSDPLPYGTEVTLGEATPTTVAGGTWTGYEFDHPTFTIGDKTTFEVVLTNSIERDLGGFAVTKAVEGSGAALIGEDAEFTVNYSYPAGDWYEAGEGTLTVTNGGTASVDGLPAGAVVTLEEVLPADPENGSWVSASFPDGNIVTVGKNQVAEVALVNEVALGEGGFQIQKLLDGNGKHLVADGATFTVDYTYKAGVGFEAGSGSLEVTADGTPTVVEGLPAGAVVTFTEQAPAGVDGATWQGHKFSTDTVTIGKSDVVEVTLTNTITKNHSLATTGSSGLGVMAGAAGLLLLAGGAALVATRRKKAHSTGSDA